MPRTSLKPFFILACLLITARCTGTAHALDFTTDTIVKKVAEKSFLKEKVQYSATDSMILDKTNEKAYLFNNAVVIYEDMKLTAGFIEIDFGNDLVHAFGIKDSVGNIIQKPVMEQPEEKFTAGEINYNFKTKKGKIKEVITQQNDGFVHGKDIKKDSSNTYYVGHGKYTTCDLEDPHYYISAEKIKIIPNDKIITGPALLYFEDVPTPLGVPFGFFPNKKGRSSGILIPTYGESNNLGFFLRNGGFYFGMSEYVDAALRGDIYSNGSFGANINSNYRQRYNFGGNLHLNYSRIIQGDRDLPNSKILNTFFVRWSHQQDSKTHPNSRFSANVNAGSSEYNRYNGSVTGDYLANTFQSNIGYSKTFVGTPFNFSANARHNQNTITRIVDASIPELALTMNRIYPFKNQESIGTKWYDKIGVSAAANARNDISGKDSTIFTEKTLDQMRKGVNLNVPISTSLNVLRYFTLTPSANASSRIYFETIRKTYDPVERNVFIDTIPEVRLANDYSISAGLSTRIYGNYFFKTKRLKQIRHIATPTLSTSYRPDFSESQYGYYRSVKDSLNNVTQYSIFQNGIYGSPLSGRSGIIAFSLGNNLEAKTKVKSDSGSVNKKIKLIDNFDVSFAYNIAVKSYNWSNINLSGRTKLFKKMDVLAGASLNPYQLDASGKTVEQFEWKNDRIGRLTSANLSLSTNLQSGENKNKNKKKTSPNASPDELDYINNHPDYYVDFNVPWNLNIYYNLNYSKPVFTEQITQSVTFNGDISLTSKWKISLASGYDFTSKKATITSVGVYRDLHCWEMHFNWVPFGFRQSFMINVNVKSAVLKDLRLIRRKEWYDY